MSNSNVLLGLLFLTSCEFVNNILLLGQLHPIYSTSYFLFYALSLQDFSPLFNWIAAGFFFNYLLKLHLSLILLSSSKRKKNATLNSILNLPMLQQPVIILCIYKDSLWTKSTIKGEL